MPCDVCGGTGVVWALFAGVTEEAVPCAACRVTSTPRETACWHGLVVEVCDACQLEESREELRRLADRVKTIADEAFGPFPVQSTDDALTAIERGIFELRRAAANAP